MTRTQRPTKEELLAAKGKPVPDVIAKGLKVLFCGINPGLYTAAVGHHFARPGNRFWPALYASGFTDRLFSPFEESELLKIGYGITNVVNKATATADELSKVELIEGGKLLEKKVLKYRPKVIALLGIGAYRAAFKRPKAVLGKQDEMIGDSMIWILPNPSGLNAHYQPKDLAIMFREFRIETENISSEVRKLINSKFPHL
jgi:double-stranded uracil-DNA glycosylase